MPLPRARAPARLAAKRLGTMTTPGGLRQAVRPGFMEAAQKSKVSHGFPEKQLPQFDAEVVIWAKALLAKCDEARARADTLPAGDDAVASPRSRDSTRQKQVSTRS